MPLIAIVIHRQALAVNLQIAPRFRHCAWQTSTKYNARRYDRAGRHRREKVISEKETLEQARANQTEELAPQRLHQPEQPGHDGGHAQRKSVAPHRFYDDYTAGEVIVRRWRLMADSSEKRHRQHEHKQDCATVFEKNVIA